MQTHGDFEVIVCDNYTESSCKQEFDRHSDGRFRYVRPPAPLAMHDNWEYCLGHARGDYVTVLIDKTVLRPLALETVANAIKSHPADVYSWRSEAFYLTREIFGDTRSGFYVPCWTDMPPQYIDGPDEVRRRLSFDTRIGAEGVNYYYGKICFGAYSRELIERIKGRYERLFPPVSPDYTSMLLALLAAEATVDVGATLHVSLNTAVSNGMLGALDASYVLGFFRLIDPTLAILQKFPISGLYAAFHNTIAYDYQAMLTEDGGSQNWNIDFANLANLAWEDLAAVMRWPSDDERKSQFAILQAWASRQAANVRLRIDPRVMTLPPLPEPPRRSWQDIKRTVRRWMHCEDHTFPYYRSVIDALAKRDVTVKRG